MTTWEETLREVCPAGSTITSVLLDIISARTAPKRVYTLFVYHNGEVFQLDRFLIDAGWYRESISERRCSGLLTTGTSSDIVERLSYHLYAIPRALYVREIR